MPNFNPQQNFRFEVIAENSVMLFYDISDMKLASTTLVQLCATLQSQLAQFICEQVPAYNTLLISFEGITHAQLIHKIKNTLALMTQHSEPLTSHHHIFPVCYHPTLALDIQSLAKKKGLSCAQVISFHTQQQYQVFAIGFAPGFAYLGDVNPKIAAQRHASPRAQVPAGSVGIADRQTAIYPATSPGGWQIIGRCPITMFNIKATPPCPIRVGDTVQFKAISLEDYKIQGGQP